MELSDGTRVGPYDIVGQLGSGGMGVVYRARDQRLGREVALKVLPSELNGDPDRLRRFRQETYVAGSLNHPNLVVVFDAGVWEGAPYLVTELLDGESLRQRLRRGKLSLATAVDYGLQIARGLAAAHAKGVVHRDIKPDNLFLTRDGRIKILDFGLAKALSTTPPADLTFSQTATGQALGTAGYMSPEQVRGHSADARSDIFAFGAVLYEMITGEPAFGGQSLVERGYAVLNGEVPSLAEKGIRAPPTLERVLKRCLEKEPQERFQSAQDVAFALEGLLTDSGRLAVPVAPGRLGEWSRKGLFGALGLSLLLLAGLGIWAVRQSSMGVLPPEAPHFTRINFRRGMVTSARFSPDGKSVVYSASVEGQLPQVFLATPGNPEARTLTSLNNGLMAVSSRGEMALGESSEGAAHHEAMLYRANLAGGAPRAVVEAVRDADWSPDGEELLVVRGKDGRSTLEFPPGKVLLEKDGWITNPRFSPLGDSVAFIHHPVPGDDRGTLELLHLPDRTTERISGPWYSLEGLAWQRDGKEIWFTAAEHGDFNRAVRTVRPGGGERILFRGPGSLVLEDMGPDGKALLVRKDTRARIRGMMPGWQEEQDLSWFDGSIPEALSPDGKLLLFSEGLEAATPDSQVYLRRMDGSPAIHLTQGMARALSPDGKWALVSPQDPFNTLALVPAGAGDHRSLTPGNLAAIESAQFFPDGRQVLIVGREAGKGNRAWVQSIEDGRPPKPLVGEGGLTQAMPGPDGESVALFRPDGRTSLQPVKGGPEVTLRIPKGFFPFQWSEDGKSAFIKKGGTADYSVAPQEILKVDLDTGRILPWAQLGPKERLGKSHPTQVLVTPDGKTYVYGYMSATGELYQAEGIR